MKHTLKAKYMPCSCQMISSSWLWIIHVSLLTHTTASLSRIHVSSLPCRYCPTWHEASLAPDAKSTITQISPGAWRAGGQAHLTTTSANMLQKAKTITPKWPSTGSSANHSCAGQHTVFQRLRRISTSVCVWCKRWGFSQIICNLYY